MFGIVACGPSAEENAADAADADAMANEMFEAAEDAMEEVVAEEVVAEEVVAEEVVAEEGEEHVHVEGEEHTH